VGASVFKKYGITRLEGTAISSLTLTKTPESTKRVFSIKDEKRLMSTGFTKTILDIEAIKEAYEGGQYRGLIEACCDIEEVTTPGVVKLKINKHKSKHSNEYLEEAA
jgi:hypothetical protein